MKAAELAIWMVSGVLVFSGCNAKMPFNQLGSAASQPPPAPTGQPVANSDPYVMTADCAGPYITFTIANMSKTPLPVKKEYFAMVVPGNKKEVIPYDKQTDIIDLPEDSVIPPERAISGRARFKRSPAPVGNRLVFKPDNIGTYAEIQTQVSMNEKKTGGAPDMVTR